MDRLWTEVSSLQIQIKKKRLPSSSVGISRDTTTRFSGWLNQIYILSYHIRQNQMKMIQLPAENAACWRSWGTQRFGSFLVCLFPFVSMLDFFLHFHFIFHSAVNILRQLHKQTWEKYHWTNCSTQLFFVPSVCVRRQKNTCQEADTLLMIPFCF